MGNVFGGDSHHVVYQTNYVHQTPPQVIQQVETQQKQIETLKINQQTENYGTIMHNLTNNFIKNISELKLTEAITDKQGKKHIGFIGPISTGKTTMINTLCNIKLPVSLGHCTEGCKKVHTHDNTVIWDMCGTNDDYKFYNSKTLGFIASLDKVAILFSTDISAIANILRVVNEINPNIVLIRSKVDQHNKLNCRSIEEEHVRDEQAVSELLGKNIKVYNTSSLNIMNSTGNKFDWEIVKNLLLK